MLNLVKKYKLNRCISAGFTPPPSQSFSNVRMWYDVPFSVLDSSCPDAFIGVKCLCNTLMCVAAVLVTATWQSPADASVSCLQFMDEWSNCVFMLA